MVSSNLSTSKRGLGSFCHTPQKAALSVRPLALALAILRAVVRVLLCFGVCCRALPFEEIVRFIIPWYCCRHASLSSEPSLGGFPLSKDGVVLPFVPSPVAHFPSSCNNWLLLSIVTPWLVDSYYCSQPVTMLRYRVHGCAVHLRHQTRSPFVPPACMEDGFLVVEHA